MLNIVRRSQLIGLMVVDRSTAAYLGEVEEVWLDDFGQVVYVSGTEGFLPLEQVAGVSTQALWLYGNLPMPKPIHLNRSRLTVRSATGQAMGWVDDLLFDWQTGDITAYVLAGEIAQSLGGRAVLAPDDVETIEVGYLILQAGATERLHSENGLQQFLSEKSHQVRHLVELMRDRLHHLINPHDHPDVIRVKIQTVGDEFANSHDHHTVTEAIAVLQQEWHQLQTDISRAAHRTQSAFEAAWKYLIRHTESGGGNHG